MGALASTTFCENGHVVNDIPHHGIDMEWEGCRVHGYFDGAPEDKCTCWMGRGCPVCGSKKYYSQCEWGDEDYPQFVPTTPVRHDECIGEPIDVMYEGERIRACPIRKMPVYDISKLLSNHPESCTTRPSHT